MFVLEACGGRGCGGVQATPRRGIWKNKNITVDIKLNLLTTCVFSVLLYAADTGTIKKHERRLLAFEMRCYQNLLNIRWHQQVTNDSIRQQLNTQ